jgi:hypothetical protein
MTLALTFLFAVFTVPSPHVAGAVYLPAQSANSQDTQNQSIAPAAAPKTKPVIPASGPSKTSPAKTSLKKAQGKKKTTDKCKIAAATRTNSGAAPPAPSGETSGMSATPKACPPPKIVVRQGGTSEPAIQLAGGTTGSQAQAKEKDNVTQMLDSTEGNLKKLSERQLNSGEQDTVAQIRQFVDQSKTAEGLGDTERARTLAWKAQTLSDDLVNPKK